MKIICEHCKIEFESESKRRFCPKCSRYKKKPRIWSGYLDGYLKKNLTAAKEVIKKDWDMVFIVDGYEGVGKSVLAQQCAKFCDESFNIDRISFTPKEFIASINKADRFQAVVYDEAFSGMSSRSALSEINRSLMATLAEIRQKNLWVFIVLPCFFELDKYAAVWRSRGLIHVYTRDNFKRGSFSFYNQNKKKSLYILGKKYYSYTKPAPNFFGAFTAGYVVDEQEYRQKKLDALKGREREKKVKVPAYTIKLQQRLAASIGALRDSGWTIAKIAERVGLSSRWIDKLIQNNKLRGEIPKEIGFSDEVRHHDIVNTTNLTKKVEL